jgi:hypothetical protein
VKQLRQSQFAAIAKHLLDSRPLGSSVFVFRQFDGNIEHVVVSMFLFGDRNGAIRNMEVLLNQGHQFDFECRRNLKIVRVTRVTLLRDDELQAAFGFKRSVFTRLEEIKQTHH